MLIPRYLNLCYGDPLFARNPSLGGPSASTDGTPASTNAPSQGLGAGPSRPGPGKECRYLHFHVQAAKQYHAQEPPEADRLPEDLARRIRQGLGLQDGSVANEGQGARAEAATGKAEASEQCQAGSEMAVASRRKRKQWINCDLRSFDYSVLGQ